MKRYSFTIFKRDRLRKGLQPYALLSVIDDENGMIQEDDSILLPNLSLAKQMVYFVEKNFNVDFEINEL